MRTIINEFVGSIFTKIEQSDDDKIVFTKDNGDIYTMYHDQDCSENVYIEDICGDLSDLIDTPMITAEERSNCDDPPVASDDDYGADSYTWTYYTFRTRKGTVDIRWFGESNGYYSESVDIAKNNERKYD